MRYEIQIHFANCGQVLWHEEIEDVEEWIIEVMAQPKIVAVDDDPLRYFGIDMSTVTAIIVSEKKKELDIWSRTYATCKGKVEEDNQQQHTGNGGKRPPPEASGSCCY